MTIQEVKQISKILPKFVMMCENDLEEDEHKIPGNPLIYKDVQNIEKLITKLNNCINFVNISIFK